jgi:hypothetical protein
MKASWVFLALAGVLATLHPQPRLAGQELKLGNGVAPFGSVAEVPLTLTSSSDPVEGLVAAFDWNPANGSGQDILRGSAITGAEVFNFRIEDSFGVVGLVVDIDGVGPSAIPPGSDLDVATVQIRCVGARPGAPTLTAVEFRDGAYAMVGDDPKLDNILVVGGASIGVSDGLELTDGSFRCSDALDELSIESGGNDGGSGDECGGVRVLLRNTAEVEGFVTAICHNSTDLELVGIDLGAAAAAADFVESEIDPFVGGTFGVVMDLFSPMADPPNIPPGSGQHVATYRYCCRSLPPAGSAPVCHPLTFCDGVLGSPPKDNILVVGGLSIGTSDGLQLRDGEFCCAPVVPSVEDCDNGIDDDGDGLVDADDPDCSNLVMFLCGGADLNVDANQNDIPDVTASRTDSVKITFYIKNLEDNLLGHAQFDHLQGFSMSVQYDCRLTCREAIDIRGTILEAIGAEFVSIQCDNDPADGDLCELVIGVLVDALPPFDGATIPPLPGPQSIGCVTFDIDEDAQCGDKLPLLFVDGLNGRGRVPIKNLVSAENHSRGPQLMPCEVCVVEEERFFRGDCNFSLMGMMAVNIADAAAVVSFLFLPGSWNFQPPCLDACDCNDDGRIDLADTVCILQFLFQFGRFPPAPGPGFDENIVETPRGPDPTDDKLDCVAGRDCEVIAPPRFIRLGFSAIPDTINPAVMVRFTDRATFTFEDETPDTHNDFQIDASSGPGDSPGLTGDIDGTFTVGTISVVTIPGSQVLETATVSGLGRITLRDAAGLVFRANLEWVDITTLNTSTTLNVQGRMNLSALSYSGANQDLRILASTPTGRIQATFFLARGTRLSTLVRDGGDINEFSGNLSNFP